MKNIKLALSGALLLSLASTSLYGAEFNAIEGLGNTYGVALAINNAGTVVVGYADSGTGYQAFRWTQAGGMVGLGDLAGGTFHSEARGISIDGSVIVGYGTSFNGTEAFRWTQAGGMIGLGDLAGGSFYSLAQDVSSEGTVVVGFSDATNGNEAFRWTQAGGMVGLGDLAGGAFSSIAYGVNSDGSVVVGASSSANGTEAFRWTQATGMVGLGDLAGGGFYSKANAINGDGSVIVGFGTSVNGSEAFRWTQAGGMVGLGDLAGGGFGSEALATNSSGTVIVGYGTSASGMEAFRWTNAKGMQSLGEWLAEDGVTLIGWNSTNAGGVSDDGNIIVGSGVTANGREAFIARGGSGLIGLASFTTSLESANSVIAQAVSFAQTAMHGAHGHPGANRELNDKLTMWVAGDMAYDNYHENKDHLQLAEMGMAYKYNDFLTLSASLGKMWGKGTLIFGGDSKSHGKYMAVDTDIKLSNAVPIYMTVSYLYGDNDVNVNRGYENAGSLDSSNALTQQNIQALRTRLQWQKFQETEHTFFHPYVEYNVIEVKTDAYTETGGGFPAIYNASEESVSDFRLGFDADYAFMAKNRLITTAELVHRFDEKGQGVSGQIIGLSAFEIDGRKYDQDWARGTVGLEHTLDVGRITLTLNMSSEGEDPHYWSGLNYSVAF